MPPAKSTVDQSLKAGYVLSFVVLTFGMSFLYSAAPWIVAFAMSGPVDWNDVFRTAVPAVEHAVMWNDKLCVPQMELTFFNPGAMGHSLVLVDLKTNESRTIKTRIPPGTLKLVPDGDVLWCLNGSNVYRVQGDAVTTTPTGTTLTSVESAFLYRGTLAVLEESLIPGTIVGTSNYHLLVWTGSGWRDDGRVLLPVPIDVSDVDSAADSEASNAVIGFNGPVEIRVLNVQGKTQAARGAEADAQAGERTGAGGCGDAGEIGIGEAGLREELAKRREQPLGLACRHVLNEEVDAIRLAPQRKLQPWGGGVDGEDDAH